MDGQDSGGGGQPPPENVTPETIMNVYETSLAFLSAYGWFVLLGVAALIFLYTRLQPYLTRLQEQREEDAYHKKYDSGTVLRRQEAMDAARRRLQDEHDQQAAVFAAKQKEREEQKRQERLEDYDRHQEGKGYKLRAKKEDEPTPGGSQPKPKKKPLRDPDFNPLMGASGAACYRPARRGGAGGG